MSDTGKDSQPRVILVTGSNSGIGYELVRLLAAQGHIVYLSSRNEVAGKEAQRRLKEEHNVSVKCVRIDVTDEQTILAAKQLIQNSEGRLDVLVNNGAIALRSPAVNADIPTIRQSFETNFFGLIQTNNIFLPLIRQAASTSGWGVILNVTSGLASNTNQANPAIRNPGPVAAYATSKVAVNAYTIALAYELKEENIKVNCVTPGITRTKLANFMGDRTPEDGAKVLLPWVLLGRDDDRTALYYGPTGEYPW